MGGRHQWQERLAVRARDLRQQAEEMRRSAERAGDEPAEGEGVLPWPVVAAERAEALARFVSVLADRLAPPDQPTWAAHSRWARRLLEHVIGGPERRASWSRDEQRAADRVDGILDRLARLDAVAGSTGHHAVDRTAFRAALEAELADGPATQGRLGEGLFVAPIPLAVGIDADVVIVLGLMEGSLPGGLGDDPLLADASRQAVGGALLTAAQRRAQLHHQLHAVVGAAARTVVLSRPRADLRTGSARYASRWLPGLVTAASPPTWRHTSFDRRPARPAAPGQRAGGRRLGPPPRRPRRSRPGAASVGRWRRRIASRRHPATGTRQRALHRFRREPVRGGGGRGRPVTPLADGGHGPGGLGDLPVRLLRPARARCPGARSTGRGAVPASHRAGDPGARGAGGRHRRADRRRHPARARRAVVRRGPSRPAGRARGALRRRRRGGQCRASTALAAGAAPTPPPARRFPRPRRRGASRARRDPGRRRDAASDTTRASS